MPWSRNGTVAVTQNSTTVTGTGTTFGSSRNGDAFSGPDGRRYEVANIVSDTVMSILPAYTGASTSGAAYYIEPVQGYPKTLTDSFNSVNLLWGSRLAALGTTGNYEILPVLKGGTGSNSADGAVSSLGFMAGTMYPKFGGAGFAASAGGYNLQGGYIGWNTGGSSLSGSMNFICNRGGGVGGFTWQSVNADNTQQGPAMTLTYAGVLAVPVSLSVPRIDNLTTTTAPLSISPTASNSSALNASLVVRGAPIVNSWARLDLANTQLPAGANLITYLDSTGLAVMRNDGGGSIEFWTGGTRRLFIGAGGVTQPGQDNTYSVGSGSIRYTTAFLSSGAISTSDAREKTPVRGMSESEIAAAKDLAKEIGFYQFLSAVEEKGADARQHCGMTVQRAIEVMRSHGLEPMNYSFICHNEWEQETREHPAQYEQTPVFDAESGETTYEKGDLKSEAWTEVLIEKGDRYSFRSDGLLTFIASGFEARLAALEAKV
ncbi:tail fiber domain-containing protein [Pseudomonas amygdali]|uniref:tail fiber domain-containing protein n=1 Tax=Pseudomonas amygdali TaxID=47877 RepID=UPI0005C7C8FC|nr:tail fiber domain-containing protein [Pseudomonas amygdali]KIY18169.1 l-shaped tail fiber protein (ltf protein) [Pseudomonas amygdali pv. tabaci]